MNTLIITFLGVCAWSYIYICFVSALYFINTQERLAKFCFLIIDTLIVWQLMPYLGDMTHRFIPQISSEYACAWESFFVWLLAYKLFGSCYEAINKSNIALETGLHPLSNIVCSIILIVLLYVVNMYLFTADWFLNLITSSGNCSFKYLCNLTIPVVLVANFVGVGIPSQMIETVLNKAVFQVKSEETSKPSLLLMKLSLKYILLIISYVILSIFLFNSFQFMYKDTWGIVVKADYMMLIMGLIVPICLGVVANKSHFAEMVYRITGERPHKKQSLSEYSAQHTAPVYRRDIANISSEKTSAGFNRSSSVMREEINKCYCDDGKMAHTSVRMPIKQDSLFLSMILTVGRISIVFIGIYFFFIGAFGMDKYQKMAQHSPILQYIQQTAQAFSPLVPEMKEKDKK